MLIRVFYRHAWLALIRPRADYFKLASLKRVQGSLSAVTYKDCDATENDRTSQKLHKQNYSSVQ